jgi:hypothetical protein
VADRDIELLKSKPSPVVMIKLLSEFNSSTETEIMLQLTRAGGSTVMVESPPYLPAFRHVLDSLQVSVGKLWDQDLFEKVSVAVAGGAYLIGVRTKICVPVPAILIEMKL